MKFRLTHAVINSELFRKINSPLWCDFSGIFETFPSPVWSEVMLSVAAVEDISYCTCSQFKLFYNWWKQVEISSDMIPESISCRQSQWDESMTNDSEAISPLNSQIVQSIPSWETCEWPILASYVKARKTRLRKNWTGNLSTTKHTKLIVQIFPVDRVWIKFTGLRTWNSPLRSSLPKVDRTSNSTYISNLRRNSRHVHYIVSLNCNGNIMNETRESTDCVLQLRHCLKTSRVQVHLNIHDV